MKSISTTHTQKSNSKQINSNAFDFKAEKFSQKYTT